MSKMSEKNQSSSQENSTPLSGALREEFQHIKTQNAQYGLRLARLENVIKDLTKEIRKLLSSRTIEPTDSDLDEYITKHIDHQRENNVDVEGIEENWDYLVAKKGGYNDILYLTIQDLFELEEDPIQFLTFLVQKRQREIKEQMEQLLAEYQRLQESQLQSHFGDLWRSHYTLLKKKLTRNWKEEIFLEAFEAFIAWLQK